ncbi:MAG: hypothetical protein UX47_C0004G0016 [Candidatus Collierbacteria bacterium GW2011_GWA2_46_26]|uniref:Phosphoglycerate mutase n=1 Tax=Candidatus Collierbacteria bacterium GW2011_GWA2_46_26 TaxID=1618381 RepID=A0A0G1PKW1_9BACT|nr:MAG: hypothetical protein UX47_C0004G0016 [Candidatus Collierbacteria bacterium GW2011_GWA2_46_26]
MSLKVYLARHGASINYDALENDEDVDVCRQSLLTPLGPKGIAQAEKLGLQVARLKPDVMLVSPYRRAKETGEKAAEIYPLFPNPVDDLGEIRRIVDGHNIYSDTNLKYKKWRGEAIRTGDLKGRFHASDESFGEFFQRTIRFKKWLPLELDNQSILVIGHSQFFAMLLTSIIHGDNPHPSSLFGCFNHHFMDHCGITTVEWHPRKGWKIIDFNNTSHLK